MEFDLMLNLRNIMLFGTIVTATTCSPSLASRIVNPLIRLKGLVKRLHASLLTRFAAKRESGFWEIDMTKFEP